MLLILGTCCVNALLEQILPCRVGDTTVAFVEPLSNLTFCLIICLPLTLTTLKTCVILMQVGWTVQLYVLSNMFKSGANRPTEVKSN
jgi:hypothetical protein